MQLSILDFESKKQILSSNYIKINDYTEYEIFNRIDRLKQNEWYDSVCNYIKTQLNSIPVYSYRGKGGGTYFHWFLACYILCLKSPNSFHQLLKIEVSGENGASIFNNMIRFHDKKEFDRYEKKWIYIIKNEIGHFKIGITNNTERRIKDLQVGNCHILELIWNSETYYASEIENKTHAYYDSYRLKGEWFNFKNIELESVIDFIQNEIVLWSGIVESCLEYPEKWYLEEVRKKTHRKKNLKLLEQHNDR